MDNLTLKVIARIYTDFGEKFGVPRQSGLVPELTGKIIFEPEYRVPEALSGIEGYSWLWLLWGFSESPRNKWSPTVRPPRLGGNKKAGVFATRSPFRPNPVGMSSVKIEDIQLQTDEGPVIIVSGIDMMNGTPIYDIKPYLPHVDCHPEALGGFSGQFKDYRLKVSCASEFLMLFRRINEKHCWGYWPRIRDRLIRMIRSECMALILLGEMCSLRWMVIG